MAAQAGEEVDEETAHSDTGSDASPRASSGHRTTTRTPSNCLVWLLNACRSLTNTTTVHTAVKQHAAAGTVQRLWRGRGLRLRVMKKWLGNAADGLDVKEEQRLHELSVIVDKLSPMRSRGPSAAEIVAADASDDRAASPTPGLPHVDLPPGPLSESAVLDLAIAFCQERLLTETAVKTLLERQVTLLRALPNGDAASIACPP